VRGLYNWPDGEAFAWLLSASETGLNIFLACIAVVLLVLGARTLHARRNSVRISYTDGPSVSAARGLTLLEMSRSRGVPHTALCGGRGRCTTCRVIVEDGAENLPPPSPEEKAALEAVKAPPNARLACQVRPQGDIAVFRAFRPDGRRARAHATQGSEARLAVLFLDMRGFTSRTAGQLPYDVVFLLNRFFDAIVPAIRTSGGTVDKYLGDGLLAVFEDQDPEASARAGLRAVRGISEALAEFNTQLRKEGAPEVAIGVGLHLGTVVLGEIGARGAAPRTIIGDTVNTASRLEARTKELGVQALISEPVLRAAGVEAGGLSLQSLELRGVAEPLRALLMKDGREVHHLLAETA
jgi:adenylate cyclase